MLDSAKEFVAGHHDVSKLVRDARRFSVNVPLIGKVSVPPPDQLAFYGVLGVLGVTELIPWPVALGLGVGHALATRHATEAAVEAAEEETAPVVRKAPRKTAPAKKAPAKKAAAAKAPSRKASAAKTTSARKTAASARNAPTKRS